ncbi:neprilysin-1-like [Ixodes scapularis]|uniref:neprilysin-1-like n=1 Tax=Ixodes scapularis TaxID=6945 RepID=UPI001A9F41DF|nr:neprilysin-1-like [Ixodes scapularis]
MDETLPSITVFLLLVCSSVLARATPCNSSDDMYKEASIILGSKRHKASPCDDFYDYVCKALPTGTKDYKGRTTDDPEKKLQAELMPLLTSKGIFPWRQTAEDKVKMAFQACLRDTGDEVWKETVEATLLKYNLHPWSPKRTHHKARPSLERLLMKTGLGPLFRMSVVKDDSVKEGNRLLLEQQDYLFIRMAQMDSNCANVEFARLRGYARYAMYCISTLRPWMSVMEVFDTVNDMLALEVELATISRTNHGFQKTSVVTFEELEDIFPHISFSDILRKDIPEETWNFSLEQAILVKDVETFYPFGEYLTQVDARVLEDLIGWILIRDLAQFTNGDGQKMFLDLFTQDKKENENPVSIPRDELCFNILVENGGIMRPAVENIFVRKYFDQEAKTEVTQIAGSLHLEFERTLHKFYWMDIDTEAAAIEKLKRLQYKIGFGDKTIEETYIESLYKHLPTFTERTKFPAMFQYIIRNNFLTDLEQLSGLIVKNDATYIDPFGDHMFYDATETALVLPAAYLYRMGFRSGLPPESNFGGLGMIISTAIVSQFGHEALRLVDDKEEEWEHTSSPVETQDRFTTPSWNPNKDHAPSYEGGDLDYKRPKIKQDEYDYGSTYYNQNELPDEYSAENRQKDKFNSQPKREIPKLWSNYTRTHFLTNSKCLQKGILDPKDLGLSESDLADEFIFEAWCPVHFPDYVGLRVAYNVYLAALRTNVKKKFLGLSSFYENQLFFTSYALVSMLKEK